MKNISVIVVIAALAALCSCSSQGGNDLLAQRESATVESIIDGWNANATTYHFAMAYTDVTLGQLYKGSNFEYDMNRMEEALAAYYNLPREQINGTSTMGFAHFDDEIIDLE